MSRSTRWVPKEAQLVRTLAPRFVDPAPAIIAIPRKCPAKAKTEIEAAFSLYWSNPSAALGRIRTSITFWLDAEHVPRKKRNKKGALYDLKLHQRIRIFVPAGGTTQAMLEAIKWLGNIGSHEGTATRTHLLDAFRLLEAAFDVLIERRPQAIERLATAINKRKGKPTKASR